MTSWADFARQAPDLAAFGQARFGGGVAYLATVRADSGPRVHPVTPIVGAQLFVFMEPTSPKGKDLQRDPRYMLHCAVENMSGGGGEFYARGRAALVSDPILREQAMRAAPYVAKPDYVLFVLDIDDALMNVYGDGDRPAQTPRWAAEHN